MAGTTTYYGISYPTNTDYVKDGATAMQTIATGFDSAVAIPTYNNQTGTTYTFVLADTGKTVTSNNASAVTFTIPPQVDVAWANNATLTVRNLGAGVVTIAGGAGVTVTNTAQTVAQYGAVRIIRTASNAWTVVPASGGSSALTLINTTTITAQTSIQISNVFTSTYRNYRILCDIPTCSANGTLTFQLTAGGTPSTSTYQTMGSGFTSTGSNADYSTSGGSSSFLVEYNTTYPISGFNLELLAPQVNQKTVCFLQSGYVSTSSNPTSRTGAVLHETTASYDGIRLTATGGNITGTLRIYGYGS